jgi:hypothetical protein
LCFVSLYDFDRSVLEMILTGAVIAFPVKLLPTEIPDWETAKSSDIIESPR